MDLDFLARQPGEWLKGSGQDSDIVISSRVRLARNLADFPFCSRAGDFDRREIERILCECSRQLDIGQPLHYIDVAKLSELDRQLLVERHLISRELAALEGDRGAAVSAREDVSLMFNEEDHLRIQVIHSGFALKECWDAMDAIDDRIETKVRYAFDEELGYLTACPTNVGTGLRASVMLHLPGLAMTKQIDKVFRALQKIHLVVRGLYGEGSQASGDFYQISNNVTLGRTERELIGNIEIVVPQIVDYERRVRDELVKEGKQTIHDRVSRAYGILRTAHTITSEETMHYLSSVRMGVNMKLLDNLPIGVVNDLFLQTQPAHLQKLSGSELESDKRNIARAAFLRSRLLDGAETKN
jgi:protein arginine kinase